MLTREGRSLTPDLSRRNADIDRRNLSILSNYGDMTMHINRVRSGIAAIVAVAAASFISGAGIATAQQLPTRLDQAVRLEDPGTGEGITWWVVGSGGILGSGSDQGELLSATVGQTAIDKVEYRSSDGKLNPDMTTWLGYWLPGPGSRATSETPEMNSAPENAMNAANHPNPFNTETTISYQLPESGHVRLRIYDMSGMQVRQLLDGNQEAGEHRMTWNALDDVGTVLSSGTYIYTLELLGTTGSVTGTETTARGVMYLVK
jgi:hypothetical protein